MSKCHRKNKKGVSFNGIMERMTTEHFLMTSLTIGVNVIKVLCGKFSDVILTL